MKIKSLLLILLLILSSCNSNISKDLSSGDITKNNITQIEYILKDAGLSNINIFSDWVNNYDKDNYSEGFTDADCRMTVMLLAGDNISFNDTEEYNGDYLMFDLDAIENNDEFSILKDKKELFTTMFGETPISDKGFTNTLNEKWNKYGIKVNSNRFSIISLLFKTYETEEAFVGHTGILIDCKDNDDIQSNYIFIEKIGFGEPFKISLVNNYDELIDIFSKREDYIVDEWEPMPVVYMNENVIGELK